MCRKNAQFYSCALCIITDLLVTQEAIKGQNIAKEFHPHLYLELHYVWVHSVPEAKV